MNNKIFYTLCLALGVALLASCAKSDEYVPESVQDQEVTITVSLPDATRVGVDGLDVYWELGDQMLFYGSSSYYGASVSPGTTSSTLTISEVDDHSATFTGSLSSSISGQVSGLYPGTNAILNYGVNAAMYFSTLRIIQPSYFQYTYTDGVLDPSSIGDYCYMHFLANETSATNASTLTGNVNHLMAYVDFNLENPKGKVEKVYFSMESSLTYPSMKVSSTGVCTMDSYLDYVVYLAQTTDAATGTTSDYLKVNMDSFVVELTDSETGEFGVSAGDDNIIPIRIPIIPQHIVGDWTVFVQYADGTEDMVTLNFPLVILSAGKVTNTDDTINLNSATNQKQTPKLGDYYYNDGTYSSILDESKDLTNLGIVYQLVGSGSDTKIGLVYAALAGASTKVIDTVTYSGYASIITTALTDEVGLVNTSLLAGYARTYAAANNISGIDENSTIKEICDLMFPAFSETMARNGDLESLTFDGTECGVWYLPSYYEICRLSSDTNTLQGLRQLYYQVQMSRLPSDFTSQTGYSSILPTANSNYQYLSSTLSTNGNWRYLRQRTFHSLDPTSTNYIISYTSGATTGAQYRAIMRVNADE